jgi:perosamine synthetase
VTAPGQFPKAEAFHRITLTLPVWRREEDIPLADAYTHAFSRVTSRYRDLTG